MLVYLYPENLIKQIHIMKRNRLFLCLWLLMAFTASAQYKLRVDVNKKGAEIKDEMYGVFFEDINFGADGGVYAELIKNRSFEFHQPLTGWTPFGLVEVKSEAPCFDRNPNYIRITESGLRRLAGIENEGFKGIGVKKDASYRLTTYARGKSAEPTKINVAIINSDNNRVGSAEVVVTGTEWRKYEAVIKATRTDAKCKLRLTLISNGTVDMDHISLFPVDTWNKRNNGLRKDLVQLLYDLKPGLFRFPGGCIVEGNTLETRYQWKHSVGPVENRPININRWNYTFKHKFFPDYYQSYGLGFYEYFLLCEDLGAEPLPVLSAGLACQYENKEYVPLDEMGPYIQDAIDLVEFANGATDSKWGKVRAEMGHPAPFNLKKIGIGNENWDKVFVERLELFVKALRKSCPEIKIVGSSGPSADGDRFDYLWPEMARLGIDLVDEHYYKNPDWFLANAARYDNYDRKGPAVFAGEYAAHPKDKQNSFEGAIAEAAFMTGLERNADIVHMATYAPLFAHVEAWQWRPDMIWFDNLRCVRTPNYYVQQMYSTNAGTHVLPVSSDKANLRGENGIYASSVWDADANTVIVKIVNTNETAVEVELLVSGLKRKQTITKGELVYMQSNNKQAINTLDKPLEIIPQNGAVVFDGNTCKITLDKSAFAVVKAQVR